MCENEWKRTDENNINRMDCACLPRSVFVYLFISYLDMLECYCVDKDMTAMLLEVYKQHLLHFECHVLCACVAFPRYLHLNFQV